MAKRSGAEVLAEMLQGYGVTHVFMVPSVLRPTLAEMERRTSIRRIQVHAEKAAAYMADGYARACGRPGICMAQVVGALNLAAGLRDAHLASAPVIAMTGGRDPHTTFRKAYQDLDDVPAFEPVTKFNATVDEVTRIPDLVRQAFRVAVSGKPGPVHLQFRGNEGQIDYEEAEMEPLVEELFARVPPFRPPPDAEHARAALDAIEAAERPVFVAGGGVRASGAAAELVALAERLAVPVATSLHAKDTIAGDHPLSVGVVGTYSRESANRVVGEADLVCFVGSETGGMTTHFWQVPPIGTPAVQIDIEPQSLGRNYPLQAAVCADAKLALAWMLDHVDRRSAERRAPWTARARDIAGEWRERYRPLLESDAVPIRPERICHELTRHLPDDAIVMADTGHSGMWMGGMYDLRSPRQSYIRSAGHLGWAFPAGPRREVRRAGAAGLRVHRRRGLLVPPQRDRDRGPLRHQYGHAGEQQQLGQPGRARLRPRLRRAADRAGARAMDLQRRKLRDRCREHGGAGPACGEPRRHPRRAQDRLRRRTTGGDRRGERYRRLRAARGGRGGA